MIISILSRRFVPALILAGLSLAEPVFAADLDVGGQLTVEGDSHFESNTLDFGTTGTSEPALVLTYGEVSTTYTFLLSAERAAAIFSWQDNAVGTPKPKMTLQGDNKLVLFGPTYSSGTPNAGKISINPAVAGSSITIDGSPVLTATAAGTAYVASSNFSVQSITVSGETAPAISLISGSATGLWSYAGYGAVATGYEAMATGIASEASGDSSSAIGYASIASGNNATAIAPFAVASGEYSVASGISAQATGASATASGAYSMASGDWSAAIGTASVASGLGSSSLGYGAAATGWHSTAGGSRSQAAGYNQFTVGRYNVLQGDADEWISTDDLFIVGNGMAPSTRSNAFVVKKNGDTTIYGKLEVTGKSKIRVDQQGDLSMGEFTHEPTP